MNVNGMVNLYFTLYNFLIKIKFYTNLSMHMMYVFVMHNFQKIQKYRDFQSEIYGLTTSFIYGVQNGPMIDIIIVRDSILVL
jgi:hypothetical protein